MAASRYRLLRILALLLVFLLGCPPPGPPDMELPERTGLNFLGEVFWLAPDSTGSIMVQVTDPDTGMPIAESRVTMSLRSPNGSAIQVFEGVSDLQGLVRATFDVPSQVENPNQVLVVESNSSAGTVVHEEPVYTGRAYNILVSTDKPVYQPGQTIHIRALALDTLGLKPADGHPMIVTVTNPDGNKVFRRELSTSAYGVATADFPLHGLATGGEYSIVAEMGPVESRRTVEVKPYSLPRFKVEIVPDREFYLPGQNASGEIRASYFFGKPVSGGEVTVKAYVDDVERIQVHQLSGTTGADGVFRYEFAVPDYFVGRLDNETAELNLEITVSDAAGHPESIDQSLSVAEQVLLIEAVPESGTLRPGIENIVYLSVTYPDGRAARADLEIATNESAQALSLATDDSGLAQLRYTPPAGASSVFSVTATTAAGESAMQRLSLVSASSEMAVLLRPDRAEYRIGDTMNVDIHIGGTAKTVYLDVIKGRQSFAMVPLPVAGGIAQAAIDIDGSLLGTLELNAYAVSDRGEIIRDRRLVLVNPAPSEVRVTPDSPTYRPGDVATIELEVGQDGAPVPGIVGVSIVDESVFSVETQDPGFARTYFLLERELLEPRYEIHGFSGFEDDQDSPYDDNPDSYRTTHLPGGPSPEANSREIALLGMFAQDLAVMASDTATPIPAQAQPRRAAAAGWLARFPLLLPLAGIALYDGSRRRRKVLIGFVLAALASAAYAACASPAAPPVPMPAAQIADETTATRGQQSAPRLRQFFPETLFWQPELETDDAGRASIQVPIADSITTWRVSVLASDEQGNLGSGEASLRVFQEFFVEPDLPRFLTVGDEISIPVSLYNYLDEPQTIRISVTKSPWFELLGADVQEFPLAANEVQAAYIPIRVLSFGAQDFQVTALGPYASDAVLRSVEVLPDGAPQTQVASGRLTPSQQIPVNIPMESVPGTGRVTVRLYPGIVAQAVAGLEGMLQRPSGCFEQTTSTSYPNTLILDYLRTTGQTNPELSLKAEYLVNLGYQRLLTFEVSGYPGGFSLFGNPLPDTMLTAFGLMQFADINRVSYVDPELLSRTADFLLRRQQEDGSWSAEGMAVSVPGASSDKTRAVPTTAYLVWALSQAGFADLPAVSRGLDYVQRVFVPGDSDPYVLALVANAFIASGRSADEMLDALADRAVAVAQGEVKWSTNATTWLSSHGSTADLEATALATIALLSARHRLDVAEAGLAFIAGRRSAFGSYHTTQATVLSLKALLLGAQVGGEAGEATVTVALRDGRIWEVDFAGVSANVVREIVFDDLPAGSNEITLNLQGSKAVQYQVNTDYVIPWDAVEAPARDLPPVAIAVVYDREELRVNDTVGVTARVEVLRDDAVGTLLVDLGVPPGFIPVAADLDALVAAGTADRYEQTGRQIIFYLTNVRSGEVRALEFRLLARYPIRAQIPPSAAYDYYTPDDQDTEPPGRISVTLGTPD